MINIEILINICTASIERHNDLGNRPFTILNEICTAGQNALLLHKLLETRLA